MNMFVPLAEAFGLTLTDLNSVKLIPEACAMVDVRCRLLQRGPMAEAMAASLGKAPLGEWLGVMAHALETHYNLMRDQAIYFSEHYEADTQVHEGFSMAS